MRALTVRRWLSVAAVAAASVMVAAPAMAAVPGTLTHQGRLYDSSDKPIEGTLAVVVSVYADATTTTKLWTETHQVTFDGGYFSVALGSVTPFDDTVFDGSTRY